MNRSVGSQSLRLTTLSVFAAIFLGQHAIAETGPLSTSEPIYQGTAFITVANSTCTANSVNVGDYYTMLYRQLPESGNTTYGGGVAFFGTRSALSYVMPANTALNGGQQNVASVNVYGQSSKVGPLSYTGSFNLKIAPTTLTASTTSVQITGTVGNFFGYTGCTITIRASLALRP